MNLIPFFLAVSSDLALLFIFRISDLKIKRIIFIPLTTLHCIVSYFTYLAREKTPFNIVIKTLFRMFKFLLIFLFLYTLKEVVYIRYKESLYTGLIILMGLDLFRAFFYEIVSAGFKSRISNGIFCDILEIEPFFTKLKNPQVSTDKLTFEEFYEKGKPICLDYEYLFDLLNDESIQTDKSIAVYTAEDINLRPEAEEISNEARFFNKRALSKNVKNAYNSPHKKLEPRVIKPEMYSFPSNEIDSKQDLNQIEDALITVQPSNDYELTEKGLYNFDLDESASDEQENDLTNIQKKDQEANLWISINEEVRKAQHLQPKTGRITKKSLKYHFNEKSDVVFRILTFNRTEELTYIVFRDNIRQINNERENLYIAIECNKNLLSKVYYTLICIELLILYWFISNWLEVKPLLVQLCLPIFILPAFSTVKVIIESFLFIVYSHPYDPGDRIHLDGENYVVRDISLLTTTLIRWDGVRCYIANVLIKDKSITNIRRSSGQIWTLEFLIDSKTSDRKLEELQDVLNRLVKEDKAYKSISMHTIEIIDSSYLKLNILVKHKFNFQSGFLMWNNHTKFLRILSAALAIIGVKYLPITQEINVM